MSIHCEITIDRPVAEVYDYFANPDRGVHRSGAGVASIDRLTPGPTAVGSTFRFRMSKEPFRESTSHYTVVDPETELQWDAVMGPMRPKMMLRFEAAGHGTAVVLTGKPHPVGPAKLLSPLLTRLGVRVWNERLAHAKAYLEADKEGSR